jgi:hypothetical protein
MMRHPVTFPVSAEIVSSGLLITLNNGETEFHRSDPLPRTPEPKWSDGHGSEKSYPLTRGGGNENLDLADDVVLGEYETTGITSLLS